MQLPLQLYVHASSQGDEAQCSSQDKMWSLFLANNYSSKPVFQKCLYPPSSAKCGAWVDVKMWCVSWCKNALQPNVEKSCRPSLLLIKQSIWLCRFWQKMGFLRSFCSCNLTLPFSASDGTRAFWPQDWVWKGTARYFCEQDSNIYSCWASGQRDQEEYGQKPCWIQYSMRLWITTDCIRQTTSTLMPAICNGLILFRYQNNIGLTGYFFQLCALCAEGWDG